MGDAKRRRLEIDMEEKKVARFFHLWHFLNPKVTWDEASKAYRRSKFKWIKVTGE
jgi:hypothetical protein